MRYLVSILIASTLVLAAAEARAEWDLAAIGAAKTAAETAYDNQDYVEASRHYIELRGLLKGAIADGSVPPEMAESARAALEASTYQLGRTNQLSGNCSGAATVFDELIADKTSTTASFRAKAFVRLAESHECLAAAAVEALDYETISGAIAEARAALGSAEELLTGELDESLAELPRLQDEIKGRVDATQGAAVQTLQAEIDKAKDQKNCDDLDRWVDSAAAWFPDAHAWGDYQGARDDCRKPVVVVEKNDPDKNKKKNGAVVPNESPDTLPWWPGLIVVGAGAATVVTAVVLDAGLVDDVDAFDVHLAACRNSDVSSCLDARRLRADISGRQDTVVALYIAGGVVAGIGVIYTAVAAAIGGDDEPALTTGFDGIGLSPSADGMSGSLSWRF